MICFVNEWTLHEQWKAIDGKFRWAGHEKKLYESVLCC